MPLLAEELDAITSAWHKSPEPFRDVVYEAGITKLKRLNVLRPEDMLDAALDAAAPQPRARKAHVGDVLARELERMQAPQAGIRTPFRLLDSMIIGGFQKGELIYLGARPGVGKSSLALEMARSAAKTGKRVLIVSREMLDVALARRMLAQEGMLSASRLKLGTADMLEVNDVAARLAGLPIWITDSAASLLEIEGLCDDVDMLIVDYLQLVQAPREVRDRRLQVEHVSQGLKALAIKLQIPVLCLSSLSRPQGTVNPEPTLASLRESGELEHDADIVLFLHRPSPEAPQVLCIVAKNRDGETGRVKLVFKSEWVSFHAAETQYVDL